MTDRASDALSEEAEILFRQIHPSFVRDGRVSGQAFRPTPKDKRMLSVARSSMTDAQAAFKRHTECLKLSSLGTWGVTVGECAALGLSVRPNPITEPPCPDPAHALVDFSALSNSKVEAQGTRLARLANDRGRLHPLDKSNGNE